MLDNSKFILLVHNRIVFRLLDLMCIVQSKWWQKRKIRPYDCKHDWLWVRYLFEGNKIFEIEFNSFFLFLFPRSGNGAKRAVEFHHSTGNAARIRQNSVVAIIYKTEMY